MSPLEHAISTVRNWDGENVIDLLPALERFDMALPRPHDPDARQRLAAAAQEASADVWPEELTDTFDFLAVDRNGRFVVKIDGTSGVRVDHYRIDEFADLLADKYGYDAVRDLALDHVEMFAQMLSAALASGCTDVKLIAGMADIALNSVQVQAAAYVAKDIYLDLDTSLDKVLMSQAAAQVVMGRARDLHEDLMQLVLAGLDDLDELTPEGVDLVVDAVLDGAADAREIE